MHCCTCTQRVIRLVVLLVASLCIASETHSRFMRTLLLQVQVWNCISEQASMGAAWPYHLQSHL